MIRRTAVLILLLAFLTGAAPARAQQAEEDLVIGITQYPSTLHPNIEAMLAKSYVLAMTQRPITVHDPQWKLICMLCTALPTLENGGAILEELPDGKKGIAVTYTLQPNAKWGDGTPITTRDVLFTWEVGRHPQSGTGNAELYRRILKIDVKDEKTFTMHFDRVTFDYNAINDFHLLPEHIERKRFEERPDEYRTRTAFDTEPTNPGLWFGPYRITEVQPGQHIVLERNPSWWGRPAYFRRIVVRAIENTAALEANLRSGTIGYIAGELGLSLDQALAFEKRHGDAYEVIYKPALFYEHVDLNLDNPILADVRVRRALLHAIDRQAISKRLFEGRQPVATGPISPLDWIYAPDVAPPTYDPKKAAALLEAAGWRPGKDGIRRNAAGNRLSLELMTTAGNRTRELVQQVLQSQWKAAGVEVRIRNEPPRVFFGETITRRRFEGMALFAWLSAPENVPRTTLHSDMIPIAANGWAGQNYTGYRNPEMDALIDAIETELDAEKRRALWHRLQEIYAADLPALPLFYRADAYIVPKWLKGIVPTGHMYPTTLWVETWHRAP